MIKGQGYDCKWDFISNKKGRELNLTIIKHASLQFFRFIVLIKLN